MEMRANWQNIKKGRNEDIFTPSVHSPPTPHPGCLKSTFKPGGDLSEEYRASLFQALPAN